MGFIGGCLGFIGVEGGSCFLGVVGGGSCTNFIGRGSLCVIRRWLVIIGGKGGVLSFIGVKRRSRSWLIFIGGKGRG